MPFPRPNPALIFGLGLCFVMHGAAIAQSAPPQGVPPEGTPPGGKPGEPPKDGPGAGGPGGRSGMNVFFSPAGEPFRGKPDEPYAIKLWFDAADTDHDGRVSREEFLKDSGRFFAALDQDRNEVISSLENSRYEEVVAPEILRMAVGGGQRGPRPAAGAGEAGSRGYVKTVQGAAQYSLIGEPQPIRACDANLDYRVTLKEWQDANSQRFRLLDLNKDGFLSADELSLTPAAAAIERMKLEREKGGKDAKRNRRLF